LKDEIKIGPYILNNIYQGDCLELMQKLPNECIDLVVTSPPYNLRNSTGGGLKDGRGGKWKNAGLLEGYESYDDTMPYEEYVKWQRDCLTSMMRVLKDDGAIFYNHKWRVQAGLLQDRFDIVKGFPVRQIIIWQRKGGINFNPGYFLPTYEVIYLICKSKFNLISSANAIGDIWSITQDFNNPHPAPFPIELPSRCIGSTTAKVVFDPFAGSGTTLVAAHELRRYYLGFEIEQKYIDMAKKRLLFRRRSAL